MYGHSDITVRRRCPVGDRARQTRWIAEGITDEELAEAKQSYALRFQRSLASDTYVLGKLVTGLKLDRTLEYQQQLLEKIQQESL